MGELVVALHATFVRIFFRALPIDASPGLAPGLMSMGAKVADQVALLGKGMLALGALVRPYSCVQLYVAV